MISYIPKIHESAFSNSYAKAFAYEDTKIIGFVRAISDGEYQSAIYDLYVVPSKRGMGIGRLLIDKLLIYLPKGKVVLYTESKVVEFYRKVGFNRLGVAMECII